MSAILWRSRDYHVALADPCDARKRSKEVRLSELLTQADLTDKLDDMSERELLEYTLNTVHGQSVVVCLIHHYNHEMVIAFTGDSLFLVDQSVPTQERIDAAVKRVPKMPPSAKVVIAPSGTKEKRGGGGGEGGGKKKKWNGK